MLYSVEMSRAMPAARRMQGVEAPRVALGRDAVVRTAIAVADAGGIDALTMRKLAQVLGVDPMAIYHYFANKDELLASMLDVVHGEVTPPSGSDDWKADIRKSAISYHALLRRHPWTPAVITSPASVSVERLRYMDRLLQRLREAGFGPRATYHAYHALDSHMMGSAMWGAGYRSWSSRVNPEDVTRDMLRLMPADEHPSFHEHLKEHRPGSARGEKTDFEFVLDLILDGLDRLRREHAPRRTRRVSRS